MSDIKTVLGEYKQLINQHITDHFIEYKRTFGDIGITSKIALDRLELFSHGGKGVRGGLFILSANMFGTKTDTTLVDIAATLELLQASLLIHDDIMDNDLVRRGSPSLFAQYIENGKHIKAEDPLHYGRSMGICIGDIGFFIAMNITQQAVQNHEQKNKFLALLQKELIIVGLAQIDDVTFAAGKQIPTTQEILNMYLYKTAHYTLSLPLSLGAIITNQSDETIKQVEQLGEHLGIIFQLKDDEIGVMSNEQTIGKPIGSDLRENKKTILRCMLETKINPEELHIINSYEGAEIKQKDVDFYVSLIKKYNITEEIAKIINQHQKKAQQIINNLIISDHSKQLLQQLLIFVRTRTS